MRICRRETINIKKKLSLASAVVVLSVTVAFSDGDLSGSKTCNSAIENQRNDARKKDFNN
ncbi:hypothetical protein [Candidatus Liberibacter solanacearum]|uniref:hypothetical protein n=1 Tax=Candidatus Liberibacter solanacearum TaxID=556287 RepID=UPI00130133DF|nr:hypothetical protein [Candidatus Liberibacter solanacearum]